MPSNYLKANNIKIIIIYSFDKITKDKSKWTANYGVLAIYFYQFQQQTKTKQIREW